MVPSPRIFLVFLLLSFGAFLGCTGGTEASEGRATSSPGDTTTYHYIYVAHTRNLHWHIERIDSVAERIPYADYDGVWLGGDMTPNATMRHSTLRYLDTLFNLSSPSTLWALGNHDRDSLPLLVQYTKRPPFYAHSEHGLVFLVLDAMDSLCSMRGDQLDLIRSVTDTIRDASHLVVMTHNLVWMLDHDSLDPLTDKIINGSRIDCPQCIHPNNWYQEVYPRLVEVRQRGVEVICLAGDLGFKRKYFEFHTEEGITYLASGMLQGNSRNEALLFHYHAGKDSLWWDRHQVTRLAGES